MILGAGEYMAVKDPTVIEYNVVRQTIEKLTATTQFSDTDNLVGFGLDSLKIMRLVSRWRKAGVKVTFAEMMAEPVLQRWMEILRLRAGEKVLEDHMERTEIENAPFALTDVQYAYWIGRRDGQALGGVGCHAYIELDGRDVDPDRLADAWRIVLSHHAMLRTVFLEDGSQNILPEVCSDALVVHDCTRMDGNEEAAFLAERRKVLSCRRLEVEKGRLAGLELCLLSGGRTRIFFDIDLLVADVQSFCIVLRDLAAAYARGVTPAAPADWRFSDYLTKKNLRIRADREKDSLWWKSRLSELPGAPALPLKCDPSQVEKATYRRRIFRLSSREWNAVKEEAKVRGVTAAMVLLTAYAEVLARWSSNSRFFINLPLFDRETGDAGLEDVVADFTNLLLVDVDCTEEKTFFARLGDIQARFYENVAHSSFSGVSVQRELAKIRPGDTFIAPVVFACNLGTPLLTDECREYLGVLHDMLSQTPQVWLDYQVYESSDGGLVLAWDTAEELFPEGMVDDMLLACGHLLQKLAGDRDFWDCVPDVLPERQREAREKDKALAQPAPNALLHAGFFELAEIHGELVALVDGMTGESVTYGELAREALRVAALLQERGVQKGMPVAVTLPKGREQIIAVLGVLAAGGFYVPVSHTQPAARRERILHRTQGRFVLGAADVVEPSSLPEGVEFVDIADRFYKSPLNAPVDVDAADLAYVIFTSGSTGEPKGVAIEHRGAANTIRDINSRLNPGTMDACLAVSSLDFDLSVYDIFGTLSCGAKLVLLNEATRRSAEDWVEVVCRHGVTIWNSVPILLDMLLVAAEGRGWKLPLRVALLSGDWIGLDLPLRLTACTSQARFIAMGGATEASIWSNIIEVPTPVPSFWKSIPYGRPLSLQSYRVVDARGRDCPDWVEGELWIGGAGVARCYLGDEKRSAVSFLEQGGVRWYRTGDMGRFWPDGTIEFLGRVDSQVKIRGHRIELGEIEAAMRQCPAVKDAVAVTVTGSRGIRRLGAYVVAGVSMADDELFEKVRSFLVDRVPEYMIPSVFGRLEKLPLSANGKLDRKALPAFEEKSGTEERPLSVMEQALASIWRRVLILPHVGAEDNFFELGGDSLIATRLVAEMRRELKREVTLDMLFRFPDIASLAQCLNAESGVSEDTGDLPAVESDEAGRFLPFPLTDVQHSYWIGRIGAYELGNVSSHVYFEFDSVGMDLERLSCTWNMLVQRHDMLRVVIQADGMQKILPFTAPYVFRVYDLRNGEEAGKTMAEVRRNMSSQILSADVWPLFDIRAALYCEDGKERMRLFLDFDAMLADAWSIFLLLEEWRKLYDDPETRLCPLSLSFRDYVLAEKKLEATARWRRDFEYWKQRMESLPPAPELPLARQPSEIAHARTVRLASSLESAVWTRLQERIRTLGLSASSVLVSAYAEVIGRWSASSRFTLNLTLFNRLPLHEQVNDIVGDFSSIELLEVDMDAEPLFLGRARRIQSRLWEDMSHRTVSGVRVLRELASSGRVMRMPVVFTGAAGFGGAGRDASSFSGLGTLVTSLTQTPQVWLDHQTYEQDGRLMLNWDVVEGLFPEGMVEDMFCAYVDLLHRLASNEDTWSYRNVVTLPDKQLRTREVYNDTTWKHNAGTLSSLVRHAALRHADRAAVITSRRTMTHGELYRRACAVAHALVEARVKRGDLVGVVMEKGWEQVAAVEGIVLAGAVYVPVDAHVPPARLAQIAADAGMKVILTQADLASTLCWPEESCVIAVDILPESEDAPEDSVLEEDLAYIIYTSGSTGSPKGVAIDHRGVVNTVLDMNDRFHLTPDDRLFGLSALHFDLSVYDIWGALLSGAAVVLPDADKLKDPSHWQMLAAEKGVTIWNSVPMLVQMLVEYMEFFGKLGSVPLRLVLMSGDWIPLDLPGRLCMAAPSAVQYSLGGATEASIWSIFYPIETVDSGWKSVPYGRPLRNQRWYILNSRLEDCPDYVPGELCIAGTGLARGYWKDAVRTASSFFTHPDTGERLYRTGDMGRMLPDGQVEFLGRKDFQVKIRGHRIELGEIESVLLSRKDVREAVVVVSGESASSRRLVACVVTDGNPDTEELLQTVRERLPDYMVPAVVIKMDSMPLSSNGKVDRKRLLALAEECNVPRKQVVEVSSETESRIADAWAAVLGHRPAGIDDNFFDAGGTSVLAVRLHRELTKVFAREFPLVSVFTYPDIRTMAAFLEGKSSGKETSLASSGRAAMRKKHLKDRAVMRKRRSTF